MDNYGNEVAHDGDPMAMELLWRIFYFYGFLSDEDGCLNVFCAHFCDPKDNVI